MGRSLHALALGFFLAASQAFAADAAGELLERLQPYVDAGSASGVLAYQCHGERQVIPFGLCERDAKQPCSEASLFRIGSISKSFTAAAVLKLAEQGKLAVSDPVWRWLPEYPRDNLQKAGVAVTLHHLLSHTSGVPSWEATKLFKESLWLRPVAPIEVLGSVKGQKLVSVPGKEHAYSSTGYTLLALVVERAAQKPFADFVHDDLIAPAQLDATGFSPPAGALHAKGYFRYGQLWMSLYDWDSFKDRDLVSLTGAGSLYASTGDVLDWALALAGGKVLETQSVDLMLTPVLNDYGYGMTTKLVGSRLLHWHSGVVSPLGFYGEMGFQRDGSVAYAFLSNVDVGSVNVNALRTLEDLVVERCALDAPR